MDFIFTIKSSSSFPCMTSFILIVGLTDIIPSRGTDILVSEALRGQAVSTTETTYSSENLKK